MNRGKSVWAQTKVVWVLIVAIAGISTALGGVRGAAALTDTPTFWKVDLHQHSAFSGDARADIGLDATLAKNAGYNAVFLTDHDRLSSFQIAGQNGNILTYTDSLSTKFMQKTMPTTLPAGSSATNATTTAKFHGGTSSVHLAATASTATNVRTFIYATRGMGLRSGAVTLDFWVWPQTVDAGSGADVSVALGGDQSTGVKTYGYTTADGVSHPGKSTVLVWQLGSARSASGGGTSDVVTNSLNFSAGKWNHYVVNVTTGAVSWTPQGGSTTTTSSTGIDGLPASDAPKDYAVLAYPKMEASATNGTADVYFDDYTLKVASPQCPASEFVYRNGLIDSGQFNSSNFSLYPGREMGQNNHSNQFNFDIQSASNLYDNRDDGTVVPNGYGNDAAHCTGSNDPAAPWKFNYLGTDNVAAVQASGYPVQDNHPGVTDTATDVVDTNAHGADTVEVRTGVDYSATWDAILQKNHPIVGTYGSDAHEGVGSASPAVFIDAPSLSKDDLLRSLFEGRLFMAPSNFTGQIVFNLDGSPHPYPGRYPVYVPAGQTSAAVHLTIPSGLKSGEKVVWYYNSGSGVVSTTDIVSGAGYTNTRTIPLAGAFTYVRAALQDSAGALIANTEPIFFEDVTALPSGTSVHVDRFTPSSGTCSCTVVMTKGITAATYSGGNLNLTLTDVAGSVLELLGNSGAPSSVKMDGASVAESSSLSAYQAATDDSWFHDSSTNTLYLRDKQNSGSSSIVVALAGGTNAPPLAGDVSVSTTSGSAASWTPVVTDSDGDALTCSIVAQPSHGSASVSSGCTGGSYTANAGFTGTDTFTYRANDGTANSNVATVTASVTGGGGGGGPVALLQQKTASGSAAVLPVSFSTATSAGSTLVASIAMAAGSSATVLGVSDSDGGSWTKGAVGLLSGTNSRVELWYRSGAPSVSGVTVTLSAAKGAAVNVSEWSGVDSISPLDRAGGGGGATSTTAATPSLATANPADVVIGAINYPAAATSTLAAGSFNSLTDFNYASSVHGRAAYALTSTNGTYQASWLLSAVSGGNGGAILALKAASGGSGTNHAPTAGPVSFGAVSAATTAWTPSVADADNDPVTCVVTPPTHGTAAVSSDCTSGTYTSDTGYTGADSFTYTANDGTANSSPATVTVNVSGGGGGGGGSITLVQQKSVGGNAATLPVTLDAPSSAGNALVVAVALAAGSSASVLNVTDSSGATWTKGAAGFQTGTNSRVELWYRVGASSLTSLTATLSTAKAAALTVSEWSGVAGISASDGAAQGGSPSSTSVQTPALATTAATDLVVAAINYPAAATSTLASSAFTGLANFDFSSTVHGRAAYQVASVAGSYQASWSLSILSGGAGAAILALRAA